MSLLSWSTAIVTAAMTLCVGSTDAAENFRRLSGAQIKKDLAGMEMTDEIHYRDVYERDGTLRTFGMGNKRLGKWSIQDDELCIDLPAPNDGCFEVRRSGKSIQLWRGGQSPYLEGILQQPSDAR